MKYSPKSTWWISSNFPKNYKISFGSTMDDTMMANQDSTLDESSTLALRSVHEESQKLDGSVVRENLDVPLSTNNEIMDLGCPSHNIFGRYHNSEHEVPYLMAEFLTCDQMDENVNQICTWMENQEISYANIYKPFCFTEACFYSERNLGDSSRELDGTLWPDNIFLHNQDWGSNIEISPSDDVLSICNHEYKPVNLILQNPDIRSSIVVGYNPSDGLPPSTKDEIMALGYPSTENIYEMFGCVCSFNERHGMSNWVYECLTYDQTHSANDYVKKKGILRCRFDENNRIDCERIVKLADYINSGYDKGHLAAAGNHKYNIKAYRGTFGFWNIVPMHKTVNKILSKVEGQGRKFALKYKKVYSVTGTIFYPEREPIFMKEGSDIRVPDAFFKVLAHEDTHKKLPVHRVFGYILENKPDDHEDIKRADKDLQHIKRPFTFINMLTGLRILSDLDERRILDDSFQSIRLSRRSGS